MRMEIKRCGERSWVFPMVFVFRCFSGCRIPDARQHKRPSNKRAPKKPGQEIVFGEGRWTQGKRRRKDRGNKKEPLFGQMGATKIWKKSLGRGRRKRLPKKARAKPVSIQCKSDSLTRFVDFSAIDGGRTKLWCFEVITWSFFRTWHIFRFKDSIP